MVIPTIIDARSAISDRFIRQDLSSAGFTTEAGLVINPGMALLVALLPW